MEMRDGDEMEGMEVKEAEEKGNLFTIKQRGK